MVLAWLLPGALHAQITPQDVDVIPTIIPPVNTTEYNLTQGKAAVTNTGADFYDFYTTPTSIPQRLSVMCWDGTTPGVGWVYNNWTGTVLLEGAKLNAELRDGTNSFKVTQAGPVIDPDIACFKQVGTNYWNVVVTFQQQINNYQMVLYSNFAYFPTKTASNGSIQKNVMELISDPTPGALTFPQPVNQASSPAAYTAPNVDIGPKGTVVFVYAQNETYVYARTEPCNGIYSSSYPNKVLTPAFLLNTDALYVCYINGIYFSCDYGFSARQPDVAVWEDVSTFQPLPGQAHITYVLRSTNTATGSAAERIIVSTVPLQELQVPTGAWPVCDLTKVLYYYGNATDTDIDNYSVSWPRIAPRYKGNPTADQLSYTAIWTRIFDNFVNPAKQYVQTGAYEAGVLYGTTWNSPYNSFVYLATPQGCLNTKPVVASAGLAAVGVWTYQNRTSPCMTSPYLNGSEVSSQPLQNSGQRANGSNWTSVLQVNQQIQGNQLAPSVAGGHGLRYMPGAPTGSSPEIFYVWTDRSDNSIRYRTAPSPSLTALRPVQPASPTEWEHAEAQVVPNPAGSTGALRLRLQPDERVLQVMLYAPASGLLLAVTDAAAMPVAEIAQLTASERLVQLPLARLLPPNARAGLYTVRIVTSHTTRTVRFAYEPESDSR